jgi:hypothetical protein
VAQILEFQERKRHLAARKGFQSWSRRFTDSFDENTCLRDISDNTLVTLIRGGDDSSLAIYQLIMGVLGLGPGDRFYELEGTSKMLVMDIALFLLDQLRFEAMRRLSWLESSETSHIPLFDLIGEFSSRFAAIRHHTPELSPNHPLYAEYRNTFEGDRASFVRRLIPEALQSFVVTSTNQ